MQSYLYFYLKKFRNYILNVDNTKLFGHFSIDRYLWTWIGKYWEGKSMFIDNLNMVQWKPMYGNVTINCLGIYLYLRPHQFNL